MVINRPLEYAHSFTRYIHDLHAEIRKCINLRNEKYKIAVDSDRKYKEFNESDFEMTSIRLERFP